MCTVTYLPHAQGYFLTSNRDEKSTRKKAVPPSKIDSGAGTLLCPRDADANGTWIAVHERGESVVLLNGAFEAHVSNPPYAKSRGLVVLDLFEFPTLLKGFEDYSLKNIEPFTLIFCTSSDLYEGRWDGNRKFLRQLDETQPAIWSSSTLYDTQVRNTREKLFEQWQGSSPAINFETIFHFHEFTSTGDVTNDLIMNRNNELFTVSITSIYKSDSAVNMIYKDLQNFEISELAMNLNSSMATYE